jgi:DNA-binding MarR family transcriptional regulator
MSSASHRPRGAARVADRLHSAAIHLLRRVRVEDAATGIGPARLSSLSVLVFGGPQTLGALAATEQVRPPTMTRIVEGLVRNGLAARAVDAGDRRVVRVRATRKGRELLHRGRRRRIAHLARRLGGLSRRELALLERAAALIERAVRDGGVPKRRG